MRDAEAFARQVLGLELFPNQAQALRGIAGARWSVLSLGRRSGKTLLAAVWAVYDGVVRDLAAFVRPGEARYVACVATSLDQARVVYRVIRQFFTAPVLSPLVVRETGEELELATGVVVKVLPCSARSTRGLAISTVILDELAHFVDSDGYQAGEQVYRALAPATAQFGAAGRVICLSTPRGQRGVFWKLWQQAGQDPDAYRLQAPTWEMNPRIDQAFLEAERRRDPDLFAQEYGAAFIAGGGAFLPEGAVRAAVAAAGAGAGAAGADGHRHGYRVLALDPAFTHDAFAVALVCRPAAAAEAEAVVVERVEYYDPPVAFGAVLDRVAAVARGEGVHEVVTDQFAAAPIVAELGRRGVRCTAVPWTAATKAAAFAALKAALVTGRLTLPDDDRLVRELLGLTATPTAAGFAVEGGGERDDVAHAVALGVWRVAQAHAIRVWRLGWE
jgi:hypothetical protein